ncbi:MAG TPA: tRNA preQ1(34) S-adenosylmethionine ribosyltransferase-isomerase QueA [Anaerohalosphaeraceae bacterium]|nr:tRNA preQ1(34) S-adenosylmethionine ribosyltransferase-isomerase QueA [Anaerohalosphaeraceae bacterium]
MKTEELNYTLPEELIAQHPSQRRSQSRLLVLHRAAGTLEDRQFADLPEYLRPGDCLVLNDTKVVPARFFIQKSTGTRLEGLFLHQEKAGHWQILLKNARRIKSGQAVDLLDRAGNSWCKAVIKDGDVPEQRCLVLDKPQDAFFVLDNIGLPPLPPYIKRSSSIPEDLNRYQTVYARRLGAVAAPTAGLHFDPPLLEKIGQNGIRIAMVTLHVGMGTFRPIQTETLEEHPMHEEWFEISDTAADVINQTIQSGGRIIAVGTTSVRTLESTADGRRIRSAQGHTRLFIRPGYTFKIVDAMITNFHLPKSTLLALVGAFAGLDRILYAYQHAIKQQYRFYSYGDAMLIC